ncbi:MAG: prepilin-type N-terminal cleavage/methylation domain-containing protein [Deltaproteobacteria bacterium]|nr:prepilin-type N-terminal cleavage/methylation domain-containing protein [Deltaproteobacteria bacterium]
MRRAGFTIMEVMVAIMILAVSVVSLFGAQFAAVATTQFSKYTTQAMQLARCRMSEIELEILIENGFEEADVTSSGDCCEVIEGESGIDDFSCSWEIKTIELPDITTLMTSGGVDGGGGMLDDFGMGLGGGGEDSMEDMGMMGMVSSFAPMLSEMLKQAIRRVTVTVEWKQGSNTKQFMLAQYLTHPTQGPLQLMQAAATADEWAEEAEAAAESGGTAPQTSAMPAMQPGAKPRNR